MQDKLLRVIYVERAAEKLHLVMSLKNILIKLPLIPPLTKIMKLMKTWSLNSFYQSNLNY